MVAAMASLSFFKCFYCNWMPTHVCSFSFWVFHVPHEWGAWEGVPPMFEARKMSVQSSLPWIWDPNHISVRFAQICHQLCQIIRCYAALSKLFAIVTNLHHLADRFSTNAERDELRNLLQTPLLRGRRRKGMNRSWVMCDAAINEDPCQVTDLWLKMFLLHEEMSEVYRNLMQPGDGQNPLKRWYCGEGFKKSM